MPVVPLLGSASLYLDGDVRLGCSWVKQRQLDTVVGIVLLCQVAIVDDGLGGIRYCNISSRPVKLDLACFLIT